MTLNHKFSRCAAPMAAPLLFSRQRTPRLTRYLAIPSWSSIRSGTSISSHRFGRLTATLGISCQRQKRRRDLKAAARRPSAIQSTLSCLKEQKRQSRTCCVVKDRFKTSDGRPKALLGLAVLRLSDSVLRPLVTESTPSPE